MSDMTTSSHETGDTLGGEPVRRKGDRRTINQTVMLDRRKGDRRDIPGVHALFRTLFKRSDSTS